MARYLIRSGSAGDWMVWDRVRRGPAMLSDRKLIRLSRDAAESALADLLAANRQVKMSAAEAEPRWEIQYGHEFIDCHDEHEAKIVARKLIRKGAKIVARMVLGDRVLRAIDGPDLRAWLSKIP
jgi:hypothetical protein